MNTTVVSVTRKYWSNGNLGVRVELSNGQVAIYNRKNHGEVAKMVADRHGVDIYGNPTRRSWER